MRLPVILLFALVLILNSCVPGRQYQDLKTEADKLALSNDSLRRNHKELRMDYDEIKSEYDQVGTRIDRLKSDTSLLSTSLSRMTTQYDKLNLLNEQLMRKQGELMTDTESEKKQLLAALMGVQGDLQQQQALLTNMEAELNEKSHDLKSREVRVNELEELLAKKDAAVLDLKQRVQTALLSFKDKGLTVEERDGRVYVSLEAKLLFPSGSTSVSPDGQQALIKLAKAIQDQRDIGIIVEGHTDSDKITGNSLPFKDNWDLSVMRATSVVRIMLDNSVIDPSILTAAGRSQFLPIDPSDKAKNRRIEIILTPDLNELYQLIEN